MKGVGLLVSQMGTLSLSCCPFGSQTGVDHLAVVQVVVLDYPIEAGTAVIFS